MFQKVEADPEDALELRFSAPGDEAKRLLAQITNPLMTYERPVHQQVTNSALLFFAQAAQ